MADGTLDANYFQHKPYLDSFNAKNGTNLVSVGTIHYEPFGIYGNGVTDLKDLAKGATIIIPADDSNETRALFLLQQEGLIKLPDDADAAKGVSTLDIVDDGGYNIVTVQADTVPAQLNERRCRHHRRHQRQLRPGCRPEDQRRARLSRTPTALPPRPTPTSLPCAPATRTARKTQALLKALKTDAVKQYIADTYNGAVVASF
ncbi:MAG: MetQ/NlpA family ABC transporter substrate-binding protein [Oscillospiraceae bacterium]